jgi:ketosteroid isomerase-like protein
MCGRSTFGRGRRSLLAQHRIESTSDVQEVEVSGDLVYCWSDLMERVVSLSGAVATVRTGSALSILRKQADGRWVVVRDANLLTFKS